MSSGVTSGASAESSANHEGTFKKQAENWAVPSTGTTIVVPAAATDDEENAVLLEHPEMHARFVRAEQNRAAGRGIAAENLYAELGYTPPARRAPSRRRPIEEIDELPVRMPRRLHNELALRAEREGVSLNTLIVGYLARDAGIRLSAAPR
jgi:predicted HicB family RNase H-like nuclease